MNSNWRHYSIGIVFFTGVYLGVWAQTEDDFWSELDSLDAATEEVAEDIVADVENETDQADVTDETMSEGMVDAMDDMDQSGSEKIEDDADQAGEDLFDETQTSEPQSTSDTETNLNPENVQEMVADLSYREEVERQAREEEAYRALQKGYDFLNASKWLGAIEACQEAVNKYPVRDENLEFIRKAKWGIAEANTQLALEVYEQRMKGAKPEEALEYLNAALEVFPEHNEALSLQAKVEQWQEDVSSGKLVVEVAQTEEFENKKDKVTRLMAEGKQLYEVRDFDAAEEKFEGILFEDPYNSDAIRFLIKIAERKYDFETLKRRFNEQEMLYKVRKRWNRPLGERPVTRGEGGDGYNPVPIGGSKIEERMKEIIIDEINFRQANIVDVVNFLTETSRAKDDEGIGVNIVLNIGEKAAEETVVSDGFDDDAFADDLWGSGDGLDTSPETSGGVEDIPGVTLNLRKISLWDTLALVTDITKLKYRIERGVVIITRKGTLEGVVTRFYPVDPSLISNVLNLGGGGSSGGGDDFGGGFDDFGSDFGEEETSSTSGDDVKGVFESYGVEFPAGTSVTYQPLISQLVVANTPENLDKFEEVLSKLNVTPRQIEIEARFVEVLQTDLEELGLEWILTDDYEIASRNSGLTPAGSSERISVAADSDGFSKGLRFWGYDEQNADPIQTFSSPIRNASQVPLLGSIATFQSVLTNPELQMIVHALDQKGSSDLLSAPRVTTLNGVNASIQVVREVIYPTEFEIEQPNINDVDIVQGTQSDGSQSFFAVPAVVPGAFETREIGVILNVTPTVGADNYTINLVMNPEIAELSEWIQYGTDFNAFELNMPQPIFTSRNVTTQMVVWDGHTVVMGGLIREDVVKFEDKIPLLGDIPILGRLFRSEGERSQKRNLIIFVTATLVNPAGEPINKRQDNLELGNSLITNN